MNFDFNEEQKALGATVGQLLGDYPALVAPDPASGTTDEVWRALAELGLFALLVPEEHGGAGATLVDVALAIEALGAGLAPPIVATTLIATILIDRHGSAAQKSALLGPIAAGGAKVAIALLEADHGYDPGDMRTSVDAHRIGGAKLLVPGAAEADQFLVVARVKGRPAVVLVPGAASGVSLRRHDDIDPSSGHCELVLDAVALSEDAIVGTRPGENAVAALYDLAAAHYALLETGIAGRMLDTAVDYAKTRVQFGKPIGAFQAIKHRCADMAVALQGARSVAYFASWAVAERVPERSRAASMAKAYCGEVARDLCNAAIQIHGGMGFTWELGLHRFLRRAKVLEHAFGNGAWHYERVMALTLAAEAASGEPALDAA